jgi:hypothetical protein
MRLVAVLLGLALPAMPSSAVTLNLTNSTGFVWELTAEVNYSGTTYRETIEIPASLDSGFVEVYSVDSGTTLARLLVRDDLDSVVRLLYSSSPTGIGLIWPLGSMEYSIDLEPDLLLANGQPVLAEELQLATTVVRWEQLEPPPFALIEEKRAHGINIRRIRTLPDGTQSWDFSDRTSYVRQFASYEIEPISEDLEAYFELAADGNTLIASNGAALPPELVPFPPDLELSPNPNAFVSATARFESLTFSVPEPPVRSALALALFVLVVARIQLRALGASPAR